MPTLESERLILRPFSLSDALSVQRLAGDRAIADTTLNVPHPYEDGMAESWISTHRAGLEAGELAAFAIRRKTDNELIGAISLRINPSFQRAELGYWIGRLYWGSGYCTEAAKLVLRYGFKELKLHKVHASYMLRNPASGRVLEKVGMLQEGIVRQHTKKWGRFEDLVLCGLLQNEWQDE